MYKILKQLLICVLILAAPFLVLLIAVSIDVISSIKNTAVQHNREKSLRETEHRYIKAAEQGVADAQCNLGGCYYKGDGVTRDLKEAVFWFVKAAGQGDAQAQRLLELLLKGVL